MKQHGVWKTARFNVVLLSLVLLPVVFVVESLVRVALLQGPASVAEVIDGVAFWFVILVLPFAALALAHSAVMYFLRRYSERWPRLFVAFTLLAVLAVPVTVEMLLTDQLIAPRSGRFDVAELIVFAVYGALARVPK